MKATRAEGPFTISDLARRWRTSEQHVIDLIEEGALRALNIGGSNPSGRRFYRVPAEEIKKFEEKRSSLAVQVKPAKRP